MIDRYINNRNKPLIWPIPNECHWRDGFLSLDNRISISFDKYFEEEVEYSKNQLKEEGIDVFSKGTGGTIQILATDDARCNEEGYILEITTDKIILKANTSTGAFYGFQSLVQVISNSCDKKIPSALIVDSPFKKIRGVHIYIPPRNQIEWFKRYINFLAKYKFNVLFLEIGAGVKFDSHPEINETWERFCKEMMDYPGGPDGDGMQRSIGHFKDSAHIETGGASYLKKEELTDLIKYIKEKHIEIIPEVQALSHAYWMLLPHRECAERADDPYPDTYCPSNPKSYEIYFDCLQEIVDMVAPKTIHIGHDEYYSIGMCDRCKEKTGHDILAEDIIKIHDWLKERNIRTAMWGDKLLDYISGSGYDRGGRERIHFNIQKRKNELMKATYRAIDIIPNDILIIDWYHSLEHEDTKSQDSFYHRGMEVVFGNFDETTKNGIPNIEDRLRRPNVLGAECSLWQETSDRGIAMKDMLVCYLDTANVLWYEGYRARMKGEFDSIIAQLYPIERDRMNNYSPISLQGKGFQDIDISKFYNVTINRIKNYEFITSVEKLPYTVPFTICKNVANIKTDAACILVGHGMSKRVSCIMVNGKFRAIAFLHTYTENLGIPAIHGCTYVGPEKDIVGHYIIEYIDGIIVKIPIEYSRTISYADNGFGAHWANPVYMSVTVEKTVMEGIVSKNIFTKVSYSTIFSHEWRNVYPDKIIKSISIEHDSGKDGGIAVFGITGIQ